MLDAESTSRSPVKSSKWESWNFMVTSTCWSKHQFWSLAQFHSVFAFPQLTVTTVFVLLEATYKVTLRALEGCAVSVQRSVTQTKKSCYERMRITCALIWGSICPLSRQIYYSFTKKRAEKKLRYCLDIHVVFYKPLLISNNSPNPGKNFRKNFLI